MLYAFPIPGNNKSLTICRAFIEGCGGQVVYDNMYRPGTAFFYGVNKLNEQVWQKARRGIYFYCDNAYFDETRQQYFRITRNRLQHSGIKSSSGARFAALDIKVRPWRVTNSSASVVVCEQSDSFMRMPGMYDGNWLDDTLSQLRQHTDRPITIRRWARDKARPADPLVNDLQNAHALVTFSSAAAITALVRGIPVVVHNSSAAVPFSGAISSIENLPTPPGREALFATLADNQFTLEEMRNGYVWTWLVRHGK